MKHHEIYMHRCLELALKGLGSVSPNPMVGAVLVHEDRIIGEGFHQQYGKEHAEVNCINSVVEKELIPFSTLYVSLEPCSHFGKTPPCSNFIVENNIKKVVVATTDFSSKVNGKGIAFLRQNGVEVIEHILEKEAVDLNIRFFIFHEKKRPFIILKWAQSADGLIGITNERTALSSEITNTIVHQWRNEEDAIWVGFNTALIDNPTLNVRHISGNNPIRILFDRDLTLSKKNHLMDDSINTLIFNCIKSEMTNRTNFIQIEEENFIQSILNHLYNLNISSVIIEGGSKLLQQFFDLNLFDEVRLIQTIKVLNEGYLAPNLKNVTFEGSSFVGTDEIRYFKNSKTT